MTNDKLFDNLADDVIEGAAKNRKRAMILLEECKIRERKNRKVYNYCKISPKTWALKKKESSQKDEVKPQQNDDRPKHPSRCCRNNARILELCRGGEVVRRFPSVPKAAKELGISKNTIYDRCKDHFCIPDDNGYTWRLVYMDRPQLHRMTDEERSKYKIDSYEPMF
jgi:hypothetical protein